MYIFLSYASEQRSIAESIALALRNRGHKVFFDRDRLPEGEDYDRRIEDNVGRADMFIFLVSPQSVAPGRYTLTELRLARAKWLAPTGRILPVIIEKTPPTSIPPYLKSVTFVEPEGNVTAEVVHATERLRGFDRAINVAATVALSGVGAAIVAGNLPVNNVERSFFPAIHMSAFGVAIDVGLWLALFFAVLCYALSSKQWWKIALSGSGALLSWIVGAYAYIASIGPANAIQPRVKTEFDRIVQSIPPDLRAGLTSSIDSLNQFIGTAGASTSALAAMMLAIAGGSALFLVVAGFFSIAEPSLRSGYRLAVGVIVAACAAAMGGLLMALNPLASIEPYLMVKNASAYTMLYLPFMTLVPALIAYWSVRGRLG